MRLSITCCSDCPFKKVSSEITCKLTRAVLLGSEPGSVDLISDKAVHEKCPMLREPMVVRLAPKSQSYNLGYVEAFLGNRVMIEDGRKGIVIGKFKNAADAKIDASKLPVETINAPWYSLVLDGGTYWLTSQRRIKELIDDKPVYNFAPDFEFYFGFGEGDVPE